MSKKGYIILGIAGAIFVPALTIAAVRIFMNSQSPHSVPEINSQSGGPVSGEDAQAIVTTSSGLKYLDRKVGDGAEAKAGKMVVVHYTGTFLDGKKFDSSLDSKKPYEFQLGFGSVIQGWHEGIAGMKVGGKRKLMIPSKLAYAETGRGAIPPNTDLNFEIELLQVK
jgi:FKBP-type peptidyl-prolyl cis-trans isomerase